MRMKQPVRSFIHFHETTVITYLVPSKTKNNNNNKNLEIDETVTGKRRKSGKRNNKPELPAAN